MISWLLFGALALPNVAEDWSWQILLYAVLSLTVIRMLPVAISLLGARIDWRTVAFIGWFGPRGLASIVFALIAREDLHGLPGPIDEVVATIALTVVLSVVVHGVTAQPLAGRYAALTQSICSQSNTQSRHCVDSWRCGRLQGHRNRSGVALWRRDEQVQAE